MSWLDDLLGGLGSAGSDIWSALFGGGGGGQAAGGYPMQGNYPQPYSPGGWWPGTYSPAVPGSANPYANPSGGILGSLGGAISPGNPLYGLIFGGGLGLSGYEAHQQNDRLNKIAQMAQNPAYYQKFMQAMSPQFTNAIEGPVKAQAADAGLGTSPGMMTTLLAQALAPYQLEEQQQGISEAGQGLNAAQLQATTDPYLTFLKQLGIGH